jgi:transposase
MNTNRIPILSDADWQILKAALLGIRSRVGRPFANERRTLEAVFWRFGNEARWREIPSELGPWWRAAQLHYRWQKAGVWERLRESLVEAGHAPLAEKVGAIREPAPAASVLGEEVLDQVSAGAMVAAMALQPRYPILHLRI